MLEGHTESVFSVKSGKNQRTLVSGSGDKSVRLWDAKTGRCLAVLRGHTNEILCVAWSTDQRRVLSASTDKTLRLWDVETGSCVCIFEGHMTGVRHVAWSADGRRAFSGDESGGIRVWDLSEFLTEARAPKVTVPALTLAPDQVQFTNAKVLLVGESGAGKTGLSKRLALNDEAAQRLAARPATAAGGDGLIQAPQEEGGDAEHHLRGLRAARAALG